MIDDPQTTNRPEADPQVLAHYRIDDPAEIITLIARLAGAGTIVTLHDAPRLSSLVVSRVLAFDAARGTLDLDFTTDESRRDALLGAARLVAVAIHERVKLQFDLERFDEVDAGRLSLLRAALPAVFYRVQRRNAFRVDPHGDLAPGLQVPTVDAMEAVPVADVSATGVSFLLPADRAAPAVGAALRGCVLRLPRTAPIHCDLVVRFLGHGLSHDAHACRIGCEFAALEPTAARAVQVFVNETQLRARRLRPPLG